MRLAPAAFALLVFAACLGGCRTAPVAQASPAAAYAADSDEAGLRQAMDAAEQRLRRSPLLIRDEKLQSYVRDLTCRLAGDFCSEVRVYLVDLPYANASMAPNGVLQVWAGLLLRARDEAELAYVIGHELGHYRHRHVIQQWRSAQRTQALLGALQVLTAGAGAGMVGSALGLGSAAALSQFSREHEREADRFGFDTLAAQGYDPAASFGLYEQLAAEEAALPPRWRSIVFSTHPPTAERLQDMQHAAAGSPPGKRFAERFEQAVAPSRHAWLRADLSRRQLGPSRVLLDALLRRAGPDQRGELAYFRGEVARLEDSPQSRVEAERWYRESLASDHVPPAAHRELGLLLRAGGRRGAAARELSRYLDRVPAAEDRALIEHYLSELRS